MAARWVPFLAVQRLAFGLGALLEAIGRQVVPADQIDEEGNDHADAGDQAEFGDAQKRGRQEAEEAGEQRDGGERQRMTIARAVFKNPPIMILDEATSSLDTESEKLVQEALNNLMKDRTSIVIAHRLSTIQHADEIIVMQQGEIVQRGTHQSLMTNDGVYKKLVEMQQF